MKRLIVLVGVLVLLTGCLATVHQRAVAYAETGTALYRGLKASVLNYHDEFEKLRTAVRTVCATAETSTGQKLCATARDAGVEVDDAWILAGKVDAEAQDLGVAKDKLIRAIADLEAAMAETSTGDPP
jgi:hypothetical protein